MSSNMSLEDRILAAFRARFWLNFVYYHIFDLSQRFPDLYSTKRSFISPPSLRIFNRLCDTLVLLAIAYSEHYPTVPFSVPNISTEFVEHFFGTARDLLPNFIYAEFLKIVQHVMVRQRIVESGSVTPGKSLKDSASGYIFDPSTDLRAPSHESIPSVNISRSRIDDLVRIAFKEAVHLSRDILSIPVPKIPSFDKQPLLHTLWDVIEEPIEEDESGSDVEADADNEPDEADDDPEDNDLGDVQFRIPSDEDDETDPLIRERLNRSASLTSKATARYSALCDDLDTIIGSNNLQNTDISIPIPSSTTSSPPATAVTLAPTVEFSKLIDSKSSKISVGSCVAARSTWQSATSTKSERSMKLSNKYALKTVLDNSSATDEPAKMSPQEGSHRLRIAQDQDVELQKQRMEKKRLDRWLEGMKSIGRILGSDGKFY